MNLNERAKELHALKDKIDPLKAELKKLEQQQERLSLETIEYMEETGSKKHENLDDGLKIAISDPTLYVSIKKDQKPEAHKWLEANGYAYVLQVNAHHKTLATLFDERFEKGEHFPDELFSHFYKKKLALRK